MLWINVAAWTCNLTLLSLFYSDRQQAILSNLQLQLQQQLQQQQKQQEQQQQQQQPWGSGIHVSSNPRNAFLLDVLQTAQNLGDGGQRNVPSRYPEDYHQHPGRDVDIHDFFGHQARGC